MAIAPLARSWRGLPFLPWRKPRVASGTFELRARRLYILPTRAGLVYALLMLGLLVGAINYGLSLAYLFTFWFAGLGVVGMLHTQRNLSGLILRAGATPPVFAGEAACFTLELNNPSRLARSRIGLHHVAGASAEVDVPADGHARLSLILPQPRRGWHVPGRFAIQTRYPLGLFRCWCVLELDWGVLVYPAPAADVLPPPAPRASAGEGEQASVEGDEFAGLRAYRPGDPSRRIAWKIVARGRAPLTKQFAGGGARELWLDWTSAPERDSEARLSRLTRWVLDSHASGQPYGLRLPGRELPPATGDAHLRLCLEALARHESR